MLHIDIPTVAEFKALAAVRSDACVSIYVPTSPLSDHARANRIAFEDLAKDALAQLKEAKLDKRRIEPIVETFGLLAGSIQINTDDNKFRYRNTDPAEEIEGLVTPCAACWRDGKRRSPRCGRAACNDVPLPQLLSSPCLGGNFRKPRARD